MWVDGPFLFMHFCRFVGVILKRLNVIEPH